MSHIKFIIKNLKIQQKQAKKLAKIDSLKQLYEMWKTKLADTRTKPYAEAHMSEIKRNFWNWEKLYHNNPPSFSILVFPFAPWSQLLIRTDRTVL